MKTPIYDFVKKYASRGVSRFHMPGHKGVGPLGIEQFDITEIFGADDLFAPSGVIAESEGYATELFKTAHTFYSTEGSTLAIKAMLALATEGKKRPTVLAARASHKALIYAAALLDINIVWIEHGGAVSPCDGVVSAEDVARALQEMPSAVAVYLTSPDYLGGVTDVRAVAKITKARGIPLLVDNAHGAYLAFLNPSQHPIALGADMCCDSAHKTLPALTGGAYLHISKNAKPQYIASARSALALFASTSPSYLILQSLDLCNKYLSEGYSDKLSRLLSHLQDLRGELSSLGFELKAGEPLKIVINAAKYGYTGIELSAALRDGGVELEFADGEYAVLMVTPENSAADLARLLSVLKGVGRRAPLEFHPFAYEPMRRVMSLREAVLSPREWVSASESVGRICASPTVACPPAIPIAVSGEVISERAVKLFFEYGIEKIEVVKNA